MKNRRGMIRTIALLICLVMIGTLLPIMASAALPTPVLTGAKAEGTGIRVTWNAVSGATGYRVFRKTANSGWVGLGNTSATSYLDKSTAEKVTYTYTVRAMSGGNIDSDYNKTGVSAAWSQASAGYTAVPKPTSATGESTGIRVKWNKVTGATGYRIYRKTTGSWNTLADVGDVNNYLDTSAVSGTKYTYTVRSLIGGNVRSEYDKKGVTGSWNSGIAPGNIAAPKLVSAVAEGTGIRVTWQAVSGASAYRVYRKNGNKNYATLVNVAGTSYLDNATNAGEVYTYTVRCLDGDGNQISAYDKNGVKGSWKAPTPGNLATPVLSSATNVVNGVKITWGTVPGALRYRIYRKTTASGWTAIGESTTTSYTDTTAVGGTVYFYTVRAKDSSNNVASGYDTAGIKILYYATPKLKTAQSIASGIQLTWEGSKAAPMYLIYRKTTGSWQRLGYTTSTTYTDRKVVEGTEYTYTVRVCTTDGKTLLSDYDHTGIKCVFSGKSAISSLSNEIGGVRIKWVAVTGAASYQVLRRTGEGGWVELATVSGTEYLDGTAVNNTTHTYRVRAKNSAGDYIGSDDTNGVSKTYYVAPTLTICVRASGGLQTTWEAVEGISNYVVLRRYGVGNWERVGTSSSTSYLDMTPPSGTFCYYTVQCADAGGNAVSAYRTPGVGETSYMDQPILNTPVVGNGSITVSWNSVDKATNYRVYRKTGDKTSWDVVAGNITALSYIDSSVMKGETYTYTVSVRKPDDSDNLSEFNSTGVKVSYYDPPTLTKVANGKIGVDLEWNTVDYVGTYHVYRKTGNDVGWVSIGTKTGNTFTDTNVTSNAHYTYAVRSMVGGADASALSNTKDITYYAAPKMTGISNGNGSVSISWNQEAGIDTYKVYRKIGSGDWTALTSVSATSYVDATANSAGTKYSYAVVCVKDGNEVSAKNTEVSITYSAPVTGLAVTAGGSHKVKVTWNTVIGVSGYDVYRKSNGTNWTKVGTVTGGTLNDVTPTEGYFLYYVVAIRNGSASAPCGAVGVTSY